MKTAEQWYDDTFSKYIPPSVFCRHVKYIKLPVMKVNAIRDILHLMSQQTITRAGYAATSIRGYHDRIVFFK